MVLGKVLALTAPPHALLQSTHDLMGSSGTIIILVSQLARCVNSRARIQVSHQNLRGGENENAVYRVGHSGCSPNAASTSCPCRRLGTLDVYCGSDEHEFESSAGRGV